MKTPRVRENGLKKANNFYTDVITFPGKFSEAGKRSAPIENIRSTVRASFLHDVSFYSRHIRLAWEEQQEERELSRKRKITSLQHRHSGETSKAQNKTPFKRSAILIYHPQSNMADTLCINSLPSLPVRRESTSLVMKRQHSRQPFSPLLPLHGFAHPYIFPFPGSGIILCCSISTGGHMKTLSVSTPLPPTH